MANTFVFRPFCTENGWGSRQWIGSVDLGPRPDPFVPKSVCKKGAANIFYRGLCSGCIFGG
jgi:hypothetical protein